VVAPTERVIPVPDAVSDQDAAQALINPVTALVMTLVEHCLRPGEWLAQTAAGSAVGRLVLQLARSEGFRTLNLVRRSAQVAEIAELGGDLTLCTEDADWPTQFAAYSERPTYAGILRPGFLPDDSDLIPGLIFRWHWRHTETPLSL